MSKCYFSNIQALQSNAHTVTILKAFKHHLWPCVNAFPSDKKKILKGLMNRHYINWFYFLSIITCTTNPLLWVVVSRNMYVYNLQYVPGGSSRRNNFLTYFYIYIYISHISLGSNMLNKFILPKKFISLYMPPNNH